MKYTFIGDISFNNRFEKIYSEGENPFKGINSILKQADVVGNLECFARGDAGVNELKNPRLDTSEETLNLLADINIKIACLANNHVFDNLDSGFKKTKLLLEKLKIKSIGASMDNSYSSPLIVGGKDDIKIAFLNYVNYDTNPSTPPDTKIKVNVFGKNSLLSKIKELRDRVNHVVVLLHWGGRVENGFYPDWHQPKIARELINAGADLIIGHHSHTFQPFEKYKGKYIFYSLGNFCFDDIYMNGELYCKLSPRQKESAIINVDFYKDGYKVEITPIRNRSGNIIIDKSLYVKYKCRNIVFRIIKNFHLVWKIYYLKLKKVNPVFNYFFIQKGSLKHALKVKKILNHIRK
jgi:poly-gamma-glutamate synthesis protein (capsule biosynthesis protein)